MGTGNVILDVAEEYGEKRGRTSEKEEIARKMLHEGYDALDIARLTGIDVNKLHDMRKLLSSEAV